MPFIPGARSRWPRLAVPVALALLLAATPLAAIPARLLLPDGRPAAGFEVAVVGRSGAARTGADGRFRLEPTPPLPFTLVATSPEGQLFPPVEVAALPASEPLEIALLAVSRDSVTVLAGVAPGLDASPAAAAVVLGVEELEQRRPPRLVDAVAGLPGVAQLGEGADSVPALRGLARGRTLLLVDGARVSAERRVGPSATFLDPESLASIEVARGPGSVAYGSDAFGGVIHARTRDPEPERTRGRAALSASAGGLPERAAAAELTLPAGGWALLLALQGRDADDAEAGGGAAIPNSSSSGHGGALRAAGPAGPGWGRASLSLDRVRDLGKAASDADVVRSTYPREDADRLTLGWSAGELGGWDSLDLTAFYGRYRVLLDRDRLPAPGSPHRIESSDTDARDAALRATGGRPLAGGRLRVGVDLHGRFGLEARTGRIDFDAAGEQTARQEALAIADAAQRDLGLFAIFDRPLGDRLLLSLGLRGDAIASENRGGFYGDLERDEEALSGHLALTSGPWHGVTATLQVASGFRSPTLSDRYYRGPSGRGFVIGNPDLDPERSRQLDLALRWGRAGRSVALSAYRYRIEDLVERYREGADYRFRNRGEADLAGVELEAQAALGRGFELQTGLAWSEGEDAATGEAIADVAPASGSVTLRWAGARGFAWGRLHGALRFDEPGPSEAARAGWAAADLGAGWRFGHGFELQLVLRNAADRRYVASPDETATPVPGRSLLAGLTWRP